MAWSFKRIIGNRVVVYASGLLWCFIQLSNYDVLTFGILLREIMFTHSHWYCLFSSITYRLVSFIFVCHCQTNQLGFPGYYYLPSILGEGLLLGALLTLYQEVWTLLTMNLFWPGDTIWWHRSRSTFAHVMACCLMATSHYWNQMCSVTFSWEQFHKYCS